MLAATAVNQNPKSKQAEACAAPETLCCASCGNRAGGTALPTAVRALPAAVWTERCCSTPEHTTIARQMSENEHQVVVPQLYQALGLGPKAALYGTQTQ